MNDVNAECPEVLREPVSHAERLAIFIGHRDFERKFEPWSTGRTAEVAVITRAILDDVRREKISEFDAFGQLTRYLDELHAALRARNIFTAPCCGGYTECPPAE